MSSYGKFPRAHELQGVEEGHVEYEPTFEEASVKLFKVVLFPEDGFPTSPINGSRPIVCSFQMCRKVTSELQKFFVTCFGVS